MIVAAMIVVGVVFLVAMVLYGRRVEREVRASRPAPLESGHAREAVRASIERRTDR